MVCRCVNERARIPVGADSISAREVCGGARCADAYRMDGIGLKNVKMIVEEQGGEMQVIWVNNRFVVKVMLYLSALNE